MAGANGVTGPSGMPNGKSALRDSLPGVSFGAGVGARATSNAEDMAQRVNGLALQDDAIIAAGPSTSSSTSRLPDSQAPSVVLDDADPEAALLEHIVSSFGWNCSRHSRTDHNYMKTVSKRFHWVTLPNSSFCSAVISQLILSYSFAFMQRRIWRCQPPL